MEYAIETENLTKKFGELTAVDRVSLKVKKGEVFGLVGPDGAGKTTVIRLLSTILTPTGGSARVAGFDLANEAEKIKPHLGYMSQRFNLYGDLTVKENLDFFARVFGVRGEDKERKMKELMAFSRLERFLGLQADNLSGGMKQKLALSCTLIHEPEVMFLDEPTTGVDPVSRRELWRILSRLHARGVTLFVTTPYMDEAERCTTVAFMLGGKIIQSDRPGKIKAAYAGEIVEVITTELNRARSLLAALPLAQEVEVYGDRLNVTVEKAAIAIIVIEQELTKHKIKVQDIRQVAPTMENAFIRLIKQSRDHQKEVS